eukprot:CAMPEP_0181048122 /NCGR_PEP_ID=MMETSP1070-20121207/15259_1 /TAXON_ID=265543 /ORGANISM="Minutocellus polymorphus, Strain NH13" /LENGTH=393 /DNA_ID=CAMNT_0023126869 /DNA_START=806 /DNA_END=1987 /DNA_ORIENTATION=+
MMQSSLHLVQPPPHAVPLVLSLSRRRRLDPFLRSAAVATLIQHVLFVRGIVPVASADLLRLVVAEENDQGEASSSDQDAPVATAAAAVAAAAAETTAGHQSARSRQVRRRRRRVRSRSHRKMIQAGRELGRVLSDLQSLFGCCNACHTSTTTGSGDNDGEGIWLGWSVKAALITLGPSRQSPREQYLIRFHSPPVAEEALPAAPSMPPPPEMPQRARLENELSRRTIREYLRGTLDPAHAAMFTARGGGVGGGSACRRAHVALCIGGGPTCKNGLAKHEGDGGGGEDGDGSGSDGGAGALSRLASPDLSRRIVVQRNFALKVPKMISRKRGLHRPFVVFDLEASGASPGAAAITTVGGDGNNAGYHDDATSSFFGPEDEWIALRSKVKGFRLR